METIQDDRRFYLQDTPGNEAEDTVANSYRYELTCEYEKLSAIYGENEALKISANNIQSDHEKGIYKKEIIIHSLSTLTEEGLFSEDFQSANNVQEDVAKYGLVDFKVIAADFSMKWSEKALTQVPQWGDGRYTWFFLCGKTSSEDSWKIYEVYWY